ncbi:MAG: succinoglycan biosynthesis protein exoa [Rhodoferax sp.]|nr:succinoglycan biosynthesis protein exoa [Rhodoferax sp.]
MSTPSSTDRTLQQVLVVIPTLNEAVTIREVIESLSSDLPSHARITFVVADGGSHDGTVACVQQLAAERSDLHFIHNPHRIQSAAVNLAASQFGYQADVLVRCDAHSEYPVRFLARLLQTLDSSQADSVVVPMDSDGRHCFQKAVAWTSNTWAGTGGSAHRGGRKSGFVDHGHHAAFRMTAFQHAGGYDDSFTHNEDAEFDCRLGRLGGKVYLDADIRLGYQPRSTMSGLARQYFAYGRGRSRTVRKHPGSMRARQLAVPANLVFSAAAIALCAWLPWLLLWPLAYLSALILTSLSLALRHRSACGLLGGIAAAIMHTSWALGFFTGLAFVREKPWEPGPTAMLRAGSTRAATP